MTPTFAVELAPFTLADGIPEETLLAASDQLETEFLAKTDGYLGRMLLKTDRRRWTDIVFWQSAAHAKQAMKQVASSEACARYFAYMVTENHHDLDHEVTLFQAVRRYGGRFV